MAATVMVLALGAAVASIVLYLVVKAAVREGINESALARELDQRDA